METNVEMNQKNTHEQYIEGDNGHEDELFFKTWRLDVFSQMNNSNINGEFSCF